MKHQLIISRPQAEKSQSISFLFALAITFSLTILTPSPSLAAPIPNNPAQISDLETVFRNVIQASVALAGIAMLFTIIYGGYTWATAAGDPKKYQQAQYTISFAIAGFIILASAVLVLQLISQFTGVDVTIFRTTQP